MMIETGEHAFRSDSIVHIGPCYVEPPPYGLNVYPRVDVYFEVHLNTRNTVKVYRSNTNVADENRDEIASGLFKELKQQREQFLVDLREVIGA